MPANVKRFAMGYVAFLGFLAFHQLVVRPAAVKANIPLLKSL